MKTFHKRAGEGMKCFNLDSSFICRVFLRFNIFFLLQNASVTLNIGYLDEARISFYPKKSLLSQKKVDKNTIAINVTLRFHFSGWLERQFSDHYFQVHVLFTRSFILLEKFPKIPKLLRMQWY